MNRLLRLALVPTVMAMVMQACTASELVPAGSRSMNAGEIEDIYSDHTWDWTTGAGYFGPEGEFQAWFRDEYRRPGSATGRWTASDGGLLCFEAPWRSVGGSWHDKRCFRHRVVDGTIYQRAEPAGEWYVFKSDPLEPDDEIKKLTQGNQVEEKIRQMRAR